MPAPAGGRRNEERMQDFFAMGGYGGYVWPAFAIAAAVLGGVAVNAWISRRRLRRTLDEMVTERGPAAERRR